ncbi:hypothetical protein GCM10009602_70380 [Nocardiopsis tropica]
MTQWTHRQWLVAAGGFLGALIPAFRVIQRPGVLNLGPDLRGHGFVRLEGVSLGGDVPPGQRDVG